MDGTISKSPYGVTLLFFIRHFAHLYLLRSIYEHEHLERMLAQARQLGAGIEIFPAAFDSDPGQST